LRVSLPPSGSPGIGRGRALTGCGKKCRSCHLKQIGDMRSGHFHDSGEPKAQGIYAQDDSKRA
jgi:hypothetical protein